MNVSPLLAPGHVFHGRYEVVRCLKSGGMGAVYEVVHRETRRRRALKIMLPGVVANPDMHARFQLETRIAADIESEHIVEIFDAGVDELTGSPFLVMELLRGEDLGSLLARCGALPAESVVGALAQVSSALTRTHAAGVIHRDLKPENLFVARRDDGSPKLKILDFGIAKVMAESGQAAARTKILGTPLYMSPEQIRGDGDVDGRADLYALGHIAFTLLVGDAYWAERANKEVYALMLEIAAGRGDRATEVASRHGAALPAAFDAWFERSTASDPRARFASAPQQIEALAAALGVPVSGSFTLPSEPPPVSADVGELETKPMTSPPSGALAEGLPTTTSSTTSLDAATLTGARAADPEALTQAPASEIEAAPARAPRRRIERAPLAVIAVALAALLAWRLGASPAPPAKESPSPPSAAASPAQATPNPALPASSSPPSVPSPGGSNAAPESGPPTPVSADAGAAPVVEPAGEKARRPAEPSRPQPVQARRTATAPTASAAVTPSAPPPETPDESVLLLRK